MGYSDILVVDFEGNQEDIPLEIRWKMSEVDDNISRIKKLLKKLLNVSLYV